MKERDVVAYLLHRINATGGEHRKLSYEGRVGAPDYLVFYPLNVDHQSDFLPVACFVECKAPGKKPTAVQDRELKTLASAGFHTCVVSTIAEADDLIGRLMRRRDSVLLKVRNGL